MRWNPWLLNIEKPVGACCFAVGTAFRIPSTLSIAAQDSQSLRMTGGWMVCGAYLGDAYFGLRRLKEAMG
jgi:hypothetical protein